MNNEQTFYTYDIFDDRIEIVQTKTEDVDSFNTPEEIKKQLRAEGYTQPFVEKY